MAKKSLRKEIEKNLLEQIARHGAVGKNYAHLVDDYLTMWDTKNDLAKDIAERGAVVEKVCSNGKITKENNKSTEQFLKVNAQMIKLLDYLGVKPPDVEEEDSDDEM